MPGLYGKLPAVGDFVTRRLPREFVEGWDAWLQQSLQCSREQLGESWLDLYLNAPVWRFVLAPDVCGTPAWAGLLMPSVDKVGRYFPLTLAAPMPGRARPAQTAAAGAAWFEAAETTLLTALEDDCDLESFDAAIFTLGAPAAIEMSAAPEGVVGHRLPYAGADFGLTYAVVADQAFASTHSHYSLWWTAETPAAEGALLVCNGLPHMTGFAALLDGDWARWGWITDREPASMTASAREP